MKRSWNLGYQKPGNTSETKFGIAPPLDDAHQFLPEASGVLPVPITNLDPGELVKTESEDSQILWLPQRLVLSQIRASCAFCVYYCRVQGSKFKLG